MLTNELRQKLVQTALVARQWAYAPYSQYPVGAAVLTSSGRIYDGVNIENAAYPATMCAERVAMFKAITERDRALEAVAVVTRNGGSPCGACRQVLAEFGLDAVVLIADESGQICDETTVRNLLPGAFGPSDLEIESKP